MAIFSSVASGGIIRHDRDPQLYLDDAERPEYASVGKVEVTTFQPGSIGSGTLISPEWVVTAAHVLESATRLQFVLNGQTYEGVRWVAHPQYTGDLRHGFDIGMIQLDRPVEGVEPARLYGGRKELGAEAAFVGFGKTGTGLTGDVTDDRMKRAGTNIIDGFVKDGLAGQPIYVERLPPRARTFVVDFDNPLNPGDSITGSSAPTDLEYLIARGDSGGAVFINDRFGPALAGIHSFAEIPDGKDDSDYGDVTGHTRVSRFDDWIEGVTLENRRSRRLNYVAPQILPADGFPLRLNPDLADTIITPEPTSAAHLLTAATAVLSLRRRPTSLRPPLRAESDGA